MTTPLSAQYPNNGFTLIETILYMGLFGIMITGIFVSVYPIFTNAQRLTANILIDGETAFILAKINYALTQTITDTQGSIVSPKEGESAHILTLTHPTHSYEFAISTSSTTCLPPFLCSVLTQSHNGTTALPLNTPRVVIENFTAIHYPPLSDGTPRRLVISFTVNGVASAPMEYYLHF